MKDFFSFGIVFSVGFGVIMAFVSIFAYIDGTVPIAGSVFFSIAAFSIAVYSYINRRKEEHKTKSENHSEAKK